MPQARCEVQPLISTTGQPARTANRQARIVSIQGGWRKYLQLCSYLYRYLRIYIYFPLSAHIWHYQARI